jgi:predicted outer membrane protein
MLRLVLSTFVVLALAAAPVLAADTKDAKNQKHSATITKVDAKNGTVTMRMKDKDGKDVEKTFILTDDIRYFDSTGKAIALDVFRSGNEVLVLEVEGRLKEMHQDAAQQNVKPGAKAETDQQFFNTANEINLAEMRIGKLAQENGSSDAVKKFGQRLATDHSRLNKELQELAGKKGVTLPEKLDEHHQQLVDRLSKLKGTEFDQELAKDMVKGHEKAMEKFEAEIKDGRDLQVRNWADQSVKTLREHLDMARDIEKQFKGK